MILFPAIDLKNGLCVRLKLGDMSKVTVFNDDPAAQALAFQLQGFKWLHIVDLNGAFSGKPTNIVAVKTILAETVIPVQLGGGIRDLSTIEMWLLNGVRRVILGTAAVRNPALVCEACSKFPGQIAIGIDARNGQVAVEGWAKTTVISAIVLAARFEDLGGAAIIYTDIDRDGMLKGLNFKKTVELAAATSIPVIASGGLASIKDIHRLLRPEYKKLAGAISGRALYDGCLDPFEVSALITNQRNEQ